jgi:hypothetical protein
VLKDPKCDDSEDDSIDVLQVDYSGCSDEHHACEDGDEDLLVDSFDSAQQMHDYEASLVSSMTKSSSSPSSQSSSSSSSSSSASTKS